MADAMNKHFCNVGSSRADKIKSSTRTNFLNYMQTRIIDSFYMYDIEHSEICKAIRNLNPKKSPGPDGITNKLIKANESSLLLPLKHIFNTAIKSGEFPTLWKSAKVIALFKKGSPNYPENYRPISLLDGFSKIFERIVYDRMISFINKHKIIYIRQYGFRKELSTTFALIDAIDNIKEHLDNNKHVVGIFLDVEKAFDCIDHDTLIKKLHNYGFRGIFLKFIRSYLTNRKQYTYLNGTYSDTNCITYGVPQGSILGPLLFNLYINDIHQCIKDDVILFADDTAIFTSHENADTAIQQANNTMETIQEWYAANLLSINYKKSNFILFSPRKNNRRSDITEIKIKSNKISRVSNTKYIGLIIDEKLSWNEHINKQILSNLTKYFGVFYNIRHHLNIQLKRMAYFSCVYSKISYGLEIYGSCSDTLTSKIQVIQNKLLRTLLGTHRMHNTNDLHKQFNILKIKDAFKLSLVAFVHKCLNSDTATNAHNLNDFFIPQTHTYNTRRKANIIKHQVKSNFGNSTSHFKGSTFWNELPTAIRDTNLTINLKHTIRDNIMSTY
jgi:hypothetical protein